MKKTSNLVEPRSVVVAGQADLRSRSRNPGGRKTSERTTTTSGTRSLAEEEEPARTRVEEPGPEEMATTVGRAAGVGGRVRITFHAVDPKTAAKKVLLLLQFPIRATQT